MSISNNYEVDIRSLSFVKYIVEKYKSHPPIFHNMPTADELCLAYLDEKINLGLKVDIDSKLVFARNFIGMVTNDLLKKRYVNSRDFVFEYFGK